MFQNSGKALQELKLGINKYLSDYRKSRSNTFHAFLYKVLAELIKREKTTELKSTLVWTRLKDELQGRNIPNKPMSFECEDFGTVAQGSVTKVLREVFGAEKKRHSNGERYLKFDSKNLNKLSKIYDAPTEIKVKSVGDGKNTREKSKTTRPKTKNFKSRQLKSNLKSKHEWVTDVTQVTVPRGVNDTSSKFGKENSLENQVQNSSKNGKNNCKNRPRHSQVVSPQSPLSTSKNNRKIGNK